MFTIKNIVDDKQLHELIFSKKVVILILYKPFRTIDDDYENNEYEDSLEFLKYVETFYFDYMKYFTFIRRSSEVKIYYDICDFPAMIIFKYSKFLNTVKKDQLPDAVKILSDIYYDCILYHDLNETFDIVRYIMKAWEKLVVIFENIKIRSNGHIKKL